MARKTKSTTLPKTLPTTLPKATASTTGNVVALPTDNVVAMPTSGPALTRFQRFTQRDIPRSRIIPAPYNPRTMSEYARRTLKAKIEEVGMVDLLVWNETTSHLVSGHQRLSILDELQRYPPNDYTIRVAAVSLSLTKEIELNVFLNNPSAQGWYDKDALFELIKADKVTLDGMGFTKADLEIQFGSLPETIRETESLFIDKPAVASVKADLEAIAQNKKDYLKSDTAARTDDASYVIIPFPSAQAKEQWLLDHGFALTTIYIPFPQFKLAVGSDDVDNVGDAEEGSDDVD